MTTLSASSTALALSPLPAEGEYAQLKDMATSLANARGFVPNSYFVGDPQTTKHRILAALLTGRELGIGPMQSLQHIHVIEGKPTQSAELMVALVRRAGHSIVPVESSPERVTVKGRRKDTGDEASVTWSIEDARTAGLTGKGNWKNYPRQMLFARAVSELCTQLFSDVVAGLSYTPDEVGDNQDQGLAVELRPTEEGTALQLPNGANVPVEINEVSDDKVFVTVFPYESPAPIVAVNSKGKEIVIDPEEQTARAYYLPDNVKLKFTQEMVSGVLTRRYLLHVPTEDGLRILGPFDTVDQAKEALQTGEIPIAAAAPESQAAVAEAEVPQTSTESTASAPSPPQTPEEAPTAKPKPRKGIAPKRAASATLTVEPGTASHLSFTPEPEPAPQPPLSVVSDEDDPFASLGLDDQDEVPELSELEQEIRRLAYELKQEQHVRKGEMIPAPKFLDKEAQESLDVLSSRMFETTFAQTADDQRQQIRDRLQGLWDSAQASKHPS